LGTLLAVLAGAALLATLTLGGATRAGADNSYRVDALFDTAKGIIPGQIVKIAGARTGQIEDVKLQPTTGHRYLARIEMTVDSRFAPFRADARCDIQPEGLISERFVQCDPGTPNAPQLTGTDGHAPTVPLDHTAVPISLTDLFNVWRLPVRQRFTLIVNTL